LEIAPKIALAQIFLDGERYYAIIKHLNRGWNEKKSYQKESFKRKTQARIQSQDGDFGRQKSSKTPKTKRQT